MSKIKLKIKHIVDEVNKSYIVDSIKNDEKYVFFYNNSKFEIVKNLNSINIKIINEIIHEIFFSLDYSYGILNVENKKIHYEIELINLKILDKIIEIDYKIDSINKFVLEEVND